MVADGFLLGSTHETTRLDGIIPKEWITGLLGGLAVRQFFAAVVGAFMDFAALTEVPINQGLLQSVMEQGPALSLPNMLVIRSVIGTQKTVV